MTACDILIIICHLLTTFHTMSSFSHNYFSLPFHSFHIQCIFFPTTFYLPIILFFHSLSHNFYPFIIHFYSSFIFSFYTLTLPPIHESLLLFPKLHNLFLSLSPSLVFHCRFSRTSTSLSFLLFITHFLPHPLH